MKGKCQWWYACQRKATTSQGRPRPRRSDLPPLRRAGRRDPTTESEAITSPEGSGMSEFTEADRERRDQKFTGGRPDGPLIYVASSWRNPRYPLVLAALRAVGEVYDFRDPERAFDWSEIDPEWTGEAIPAERYAALIEHPRAVEGFTADMDALRAADVVVLVCPCGSSAHLEAGWAAASGKRLMILTESEQRPDLMYRMAEMVTPHLHEIVMALNPEGTDPPDDFTCSACGQPLPATLKDREEEAADYLRSVHDTYAGTDVYGDPLNPEETEA